MTISVEVCRMIGTMGLLGLGFVAGYIFGFSAYEPQNSADQKSTSAHPDK